MPSLVFLFCQKQGSTPTDNNDSFEYDSEGRMTSHTREIAGATFTMGWGNFDVLNRPTTITYPGGRTVTKTYDREGENTLKFQFGIASWNNMVANVKYNERGQITLLDRSITNRDTTYTYYGATGSAGNTNFRLQRADTAGVNDFSYQYDPVGNITNITNADYIDNQTFSYDHLNRLKTAQATGGVTSDNYYHTGSNDYDYDALGNIVEMGGSGTDYLYNSWSSLCPTGEKNHPHAQPHAVKKVGSDYFCYDKNGNMTRRKQGSDLYLQQFDVENRLTSVTVGSDTTAFEYDASGQRTLTEKPDGTKIYTPFADYEQEETNTIPNCTGKNCEATAITIRRTTLSLIGQTIAVHVWKSDTGGVGNIHYLFSDHLGSSSVVADHNGNYTNPDDRAQYMPFGEMRGSTPTYLNDVTDRGFTGHKENYYIKLLYANARYYLPSVGRFISADTIVPNPVNPQSLNRYSWVNNRPLNFVDPSGHEPCWFVKDDGACFDGLTPDEPTQDEIYEQMSEMWHEQYRMDLSQTFHHSYGDPSNMRVSEEGLRFIAQMEGQIPYLYEDQGGHCSVGIGHLVHTDGCNATETIFINGEAVTLTFCENQNQCNSSLTEQQILSLFRSDLADVERQIQQNIHTPLSQQQFDALVSFGFNMGEHILDPNRPLTVAVNNGDFESAAAYIRRTGNTAFGSDEPIEALIKRREYEATLFLYGYYRDWSTPYKRP